MSNPTTEKAADAVSIVELIPAVLVHVLAALPVTFLDFSFRPSRLVQSIGDDDRPDKRRYLGPIAYLLLSWLLVVLSVGYSFERLFASGLIEDGNFPSGFDPRSIPWFEPYFKFLGDWNLKNLAVAAAPVLLVVGGYASCLWAASVLFARRVNFSAGVGASAYWCGSLFLVYSIVVPPWISLMLFVEGQDLAIDTDLAQLPLQIASTLLILGAYVGFLRYVRRVAGMGWVRALLVSLTAAALFLPAMAWVASRAALDTVARSVNASEGATDPNRSNPSGFIPRPMSSAAAQQAAPELSNATAYGQAELPASETGDGDHWEPSAIEGAEPGFPVEVPASLSDIYFDDGALLTSAAERQLDQLAAILFKFRSTNVLLQGYADSSPPEVANQLSRQRIYAIKDGLVARGVATERVSLMSHGSNFPLCNTDTEECRATNNRVSVLW